MSEADTLRMTIARADIEQFPVLDRAADELDRLFERDDDHLDQGALANTILRDPGLTLHLLVKVNGIPHRHLGSPVGAVQHATMMLGLDRMRRLHQGRPRLSDVATPQAHSRLLESYSRAHHAAVQSAGWAGRRADMNPGEVYVAALLHRLGWFYLWLNKPERAAAVATALSATPDRPPEEIEAEQLGYRVTALTRDLLTRWGLPPFLAESVDPDREADRRIRGIRVADRLAFSVDWNWYDTPISALLWEVAEFLQIPYSRAASIVHGDAALAARAWRTYGVVPDAAMLLDTGHPRVVAPPQESDPLLEDHGLSSTSYADAASAVSRGPDPDELDAAARRFLDGGKEEQEADESIDLAESEAEKGPIFFDDQTEPEAGTAGQHEAVERLFESIDGSHTLPDAMHLVLEGLHHHVGLERVVFAMLNPDRSALRARATLGGHGTEELARESLAMEPPHLFSKLMEEPRALWCNPDNAEELAPYLPQALAGKLDTKNFMAMSVFVHDRPVGLFYGDCAGQDCRLDVEQYTLFRQLCDRAALAMTELSAHSKEPG
ncbi:HDOD domain-containing protein [Thiohalospira halophila DSM 15071]|uniref:HDOD domain-containing protein n=1 Tax=Thiohalospira halophila DSM 15071 TaxID=1123397 RepID=A0A1I1URD3_9GAMM|nr:HDOD domain-containing protein [Thiohalospira halophila]SFD70540.1 HDOD domain-containing protein [Thiohalospira halophila DSM 15071]